MKIGLLIPCFIDAFFPEVGIATLQLLERFDLEVVYPPNQTCCGQPMANSGFEADAADRSGRRRPAKEPAVRNYPDKAFDSKGPSPPFEYGACSGSPKAYVRCSNHALARITGCFLARSDTNT